MGWLSGSRPERSAARKATSSEVFKGMGRAGGLAGSAKAGRSHGVSEKGPFKVPKPGRRGK